MGQSDLTRDIKSQARTGTGMPGVFSAIEPLEYPRLLIDRNRSPAIRHSHLGEAVLQSDFYRYRRTGWRILAGILNQLTQGEPKQFGICEGVNRFVCDFECDLPVRSG